MPFHDLIRVLVVDDHDMVRYGLRVLIETSDDFEFVGEAATGEEAVELCLVLKPDVVLMDVLMPGIDGVEATRLIRQQCPDTQVVLISSTKEESTEQAAREAGASSYMAKNSRVSELTDSLIHAARFGPD